MSSIRTNMKARSGTRSVYAGARRAGQCCALRMGRGGRGEGRRNGTITLTRVAQGHASFAGPSAVCSIDPKNLRVDATNRSPALQVACGFDVNGKFRVLEPGISSGRRTAGMNAYSTELQA